MDNIKKNNSERPCEKVMALFPKVPELHKIKECSLYFAQGESLFIDCIAWMKQRDCPPKESCN